LPRQGVPFPWPYHPDSFQEDITTFFQLQQQLGSVILSVISEGMDKPADDLTKYLDTEKDDINYSNSVLFMRHYQSEIMGDIPKNEKTWPKDHTREHTDSGLLTLKPLSEIAALQILRWSDHCWVDAEIQRESESGFPVIILAGEELSFLTNGYFKAAIHRVAFQSSESRVSLPFQLRGNRSRYPNLPQHSPALKMIAVSFNNNKEPI